MQPRSQSALANHVQFFADDKGNLTVESMRKKLESLGGDLAKDALKIAELSMFAARVSGECPNASIFGHGYFSPEEAYHLIHTHDSGIFRMNDGSFDEATFNRLSELAKIHPKSQEKVITISDFKKFKEANQKRWENAKFTQKLGAKQASEGEITALFDTFGDNPYNGEKCISLVKLKQFYIDSTPLFKELAEKVRSKKLHSKL